MPAADNGKDLTVAMLRQHLNEQISKFLVFSFIFPPFHCVLMFGVFWGREKGGERGDLLECFNFK